MKLKSMISAALLAAITTLSIGAQAAADAEKATDGKAPVAGMPGDKKMKPHSHMEEKTGIPRQTPPAAGAEAKPGKLKADKDKSKHYHPRDGKS